MHLDNSGDQVVRTIPMNTAHPANVQPSRHGHSVGRWEGDTLVIDTIAFEPNPSGIAGNVPSSAGKRTVDDPVYLSEPATLAQQWDHRPDLEFSPDSEVCDDDVAARYLDHVPK